MKSVTLNSLIQFELQRCQIVLKNGGYMVLENETCHYLFNTRKEKDKFFNGIDQTGLLFFNCSIAEYQFINKKCQILELSTFDKLIEELEKILFSDIELILKTLIIDNISIYFWELRCLNARNYTSMGYKYDSAKVYYSTLVSLINKIKEKFKCNIIVTSWDIKFDKGYNASWKNKIDINDIDTLSYLPTSYLLSFDHIMHRDDDKDRNFNKNLHKWYDLY